MKLHEALNIDSYRWPSWLKVQWKSYEHPLHDPLSHKPRVPHRGVKTYHKCLTKLHFPITTCHLDVLLDVCLPVLIFSHKNMCIIVKN